MQFLKRVWGGVKRAAQRSVSFVVEKSAQVALYVGGVLGFGLTMVGSASADVPASVTTALTTSSTDVATVAGLALGIAVVIMGFVFMKRAMR